MTGVELLRLLDLALIELRGYVDEFRDLDAALGDGDLGITVEASVAAARAAIRALPPDTTPAEVLLAIAPAVARANPSTFSALTAGALLAGINTIQGLDSVSPNAWISFGRAAADAIAARGKSAVGDKTVLDALVPSIDAADSAHDNRLKAAIESARTGIEVSAELVSRRGRAAWIGERGQGLRDPGAVVYLRFLESLAAVEAEA